MQWAVCAYCRLTESIRLIKAIHNYTIIDGIVPVLLENPCLNAIYFEILAVLSNSRTRDFEHCWIKLFQANCAVGWKDGNTQRNVSGLLNRCHRKLPTAEYNSI